MGIINQKRPIEIKRDVYKSKGTYERGPYYFQKGGHRHYGNHERLVEIIEIIEIKRDVYKSKETYERGPYYFQKGLHRHYENHERLVEIIEIIEIKNDLQKESCSTFILYLHVTALSRERSWASFCKRDLYTSKETNKKSPIRHLFCTPLLQHFQESVRGHHFAKETYTHQKRPTKEANLTRIVRVGALTERGVWALEISKETDKYQKRPTEETY